MEGNGRPQKVEAKGSIKVINVDAEQLSLVHDLISDRATKLVVGCLV